MRLESVECKSFAFSQKCLDEKSIAATDEPSAIYAHLVQHFGMPLSVHLLSCMSHSRMTRKQDDVDLRRQPQSIHRNRRDRLSPSDFPISSDETTKTKKNLQFLVPLDLAIPCSSNDEALESFWVCGRGHQRRHGTWLVQWCGRLGDVLVAPVKPLVARNES